MKKHLQNQKVAKRSRPKSSIPDTIAKSAKRTFDAARGKAETKVGRVSLAVPANALASPEPVPPSLPVVDIMPLPLTERERYLGVADWIIDRQSLCNERDQAQKGIDALTTQIRNWLQALGIGGLITANYKAVVVTSKGRTSISGQKLLEKGVPPQVIEEATVTGTPSVSLRVTELGSGKAVDQGTALAEAAGQ